MYLTASVSATAEPVRAQPNELQMLKKSFTLDNIPEPAEQMEKTKHRRSKGRGSWCGIMFIFLR